MSSANGEIRFPKWLPPGAKNALISYYSSIQFDDAERELRYMLQRLATRQIMKDAWVQLKHFKQFTPEMLIALAITTWLSARRHQPPRRRSAAHKTRTRRANDIAVSGASPRELAIQARTRAGQAEPAARGARASMARHQAHQVRRRLAQGCVSPGGQHGSGGTDTSLGSITQDYKVTRGL